MATTRFNNTHIRRLLVRGTWFNLLFAVQLIAGLSFAFRTGEVGSRLTHFFIPFVWTTVSIWVIWHTRPAPAQRLFRILAAAVSAIYLLILLYLTGILGPNVQYLAQVTGPNGIGITWGRSLGWSPVLIYTGEWITLTLVPYQTIGLVTLSYLVYDALLDFARSAVGGIVGIAACPACVGPLLAPVLFSGASGSSLSLLLGIYGYEIATVLFILAVVLLYYRKCVPKIYRYLWRKRQRVN
ncbi:DUF7546 family protein [Natrinema zhouii]|uniref:DUF7546 family protein n=1 Tax=Natrinema zhouii TaxID=1710539 RepID=UPI003CE51C15